MIRRLTRTFRQMKEDGLLALTPTIPVDIHNLRKISTVELNDIFLSREIGGLWQEHTSDVRYFGIPDSAHGVNPGDRRAIYYLIRYLLPESVLEVGTHIGASLAHIAMAMGGRGRIETVDIQDVNSPLSKPWLKYGSKQSPRAMIESLGYRESVRFIADNSLRYMASSSQKFDFIFLDGDHHAQTVYREIPLALSILKPNGVILLHDYFPHLKPLWPDSQVVIRGPHLATDRLRKEGAQLTVLPLGRLPWPTKHGTEITSLALLLAS